MRKRIFDIIETTKTKDDKLSYAYDIFMMVAIVTSLIPLAFKGDHWLFDWIDRIAAVIFIIDYALRLLTADLKLGKKGWSFLIYPFTPMAILDLICILPSLSPLINDGFRILKVFRLFRTMRVFRVIKAVRHSKSIRLIRNVFIKQKKALITVVALAIGYIMISALIILNVEPEKFKNFFEAVYWATISLTTVGYGDIYPESTLGRIVTMFSSMFGVAIIALPSGIITAGFLNELNIDRGYNNRDPKD